MTNKKDIIMKKI